MVNLKNYMTEIKWVMAIFIFLLFVTTNSDSALGTTYLQFLIGGIILLFVTLLVFDGRVDVTVKKNNKSTIEELFIAAIAWGVLMISSYIVLNFVDPTKASFGAILSSLNAANPVFSDSVMINLLVIAGAIPFTETVLWGRGAEFIGDLFGIRISNQNKKTIGFVVILIVLAALFSLFHATAKQLSGQSLFIVFIMMAISLWLIAYRDGDMRAAILFHILANLIAAVLYIKSGGALFSIFNVSIPLLFCAIFMIKQKFKLSKVQSGGLIF